MVNMYNLLIISVQFLITFLIGRSFYYMLNKFILNNNKKNIFNLAPYNFYLLFGLFLIGNLSVVFNFIDGTESIYFKLILIFFVIINFFNISKIPVNLKIIFLYAPIFSMIMVGTYNMGLSKDSDSYHLNLQLLIRDERIIFGLSNLHHRYGFSSIWDYILSNYWFGENFIFLSTPSLILIFNFYVILISFLFSKEIFYKKIFFIFTIYGILDNVGFGGGRNGFFAFSEIGDLDNSFGILFIISSIFITYTYLQKNLTIFDFFALGILILFTGQIRYFGFILFIPFTMRFIKDISKPFQIKPPIIFGSTISLIWLLKNIIVSGCFFYPVYQTCIQSLSWYQSYQAKVVSLSITGHPKRPNDIFVPIDDLTWIQDWLPNNSPYIINFIICTLLIKFLLYKKVSKTSLIPFLMSLLLLTIWFFLIPAYRFATPIFMTVLLLSNFDYLIDNNIFKLRKLSNGVISIVLVLVCSFLTVRADSYKAFFSNPIESHIVEVGSVEYLERDNFFGYKPVEGKICYLNKECFPDEYEVEVRRLGYYKFIQPIDVNYWKQFFFDLEYKKSI